jgi:UPF0755 protein
MIDDNDEVAASPLEPHDDDLPDTGSFEPVAPEEGPAPTEPRRASRERRRGRRARGHARVDTARGRREAVPARSPRAPRAAAPKRVRSQGGTPVGLRVVVAFGVLVLLAGVIAFGVWSTLFRAAASVPAGRHVTLTVAKGSSGDSVAAMLARAGVVANANMFRLRASALGAAADMKPGTYVFTTGSDYDAVIRLLQNGPLIEYVTFTIPEGWGVEAVAARIETKFSIPAATFTKLATTGAKRFHYAFLADDPTPSLEGYLFPKTYTLKKSSNATDVIDVMLAQYGKETAPLDYSYAGSKGIDPHQALTIASIIEREAVLDKDRPKIASVIYNRLAIGMRLQLDSTVQYALHGKAKLTLNDLKTQSPYNTYVHTGVPPGPICSPGLASIQAALHPAKTNYLYYILTGKDGSQSFTSSYSQFLQYKTYLATHGLK